MENQKDSKDSKNKTKTKKEVLSKEPKPKKTSTQKESLSKDPKPKKTSTQKESLSKDSKIKKTSTQKEVLSKDSKTEQKLIKKEKTKKDLIPSEKTTNKGKKLSKKNKIIISVTTFAVLALGLGLGLGLGLRARRDKDLLIFYYNGNKIEITKKQAESILDWIENNGQNIDKKVKSMKEQSVVWEYKKLSEGEDPIIANSSDKYINFKKDAEKRVKEEKDAIKDTYGGSWEKEWKDSLNEKGYDNEQEYIDSIISQKLKPILDNIFKSENFINWFSEDDKNTSSKYRSTIMSNSGKFYGSTNLEDFNNASGKDPAIVARVNGKVVVDGEFLIDSYLNFYKPISYKDILIPFKISNSDKNGLTVKEGASKTISFASSQSDLKKYWNLVSNSYLNLNDESSTFELTYDVIKDSITDNPISSLASIEGSNVIDFTLLKMFSNSEYFKGKGDVPIDFFSKNFLENFYDDLITSSKDAGNSTLSQELENWKADGYEKAIKKLNQNGSFWTIFTENPSIVSNLGLILGDKIFKNGSSNITANTERTISQKFLVNLNYDEYDVEGNTFETIDFKEQKDSSHALQNSYITFKEDGFHIIVPSLSLKNGNSSDESYDLNEYGRAMILNDLNTTVSEDFNKNTDELGILSSYDSWIESNSSFIYLNKALEDEGFVEKYLTDEQKTRVFENYYNSNFFSLFSKWLNFDDNSHQYFYSNEFYYVENANVELNDFNFFTINTSKESIENLSYYDFKKTYDILKDGKLYEEV